MDPQKQLLEAVHDKDLAKVQAALAQGANPLGKGKGKSCILEDALEHGDPAITKAILAALPLSTLRRPSQDRSLCDAFYKACSQGKEDHVKAFLDAGYVPDANFAPLAQLPLLTMLLEKKYSSILDMVLASGALLSSSRSAGYSPLGYSPLEMAAQRSDLASMEVLVKHGQAVRIAGPYGEYSPALNEMAAGLVKPERAAFTPQALDFLIGQGAPLHALGPSALTPLALAAITGNAPVFAAILERTPDLAVLVDDKGSGVESFIRGNGSEAIWAAFEREKLRRDVRLPAQNPRLRL